MFPVKGIYFSIFINVVVALSLEEATENLRKQMRSIAQGNKIHFNTTKKDENFLTLIEDKKKGNRDNARTESFPTRLEYRCLKRDQRKKLHDALNYLKNTIPEGYSLNIYDLFVRSHNNDISPSAHNSPAFLAWHRHYIKSAELKVEQHCPECKMPYWDTRLDRRSVLNGKDSVMFIEELVGNGNGVVTTGFAKNWTITGSECMEINKKLSRDVDESTYMYLTDKVIENVMKADSFNDISHPWNDEFEYRHGLIHLYIGGHMASILCSPNDPIFFFHHCMVDLVFEKFKNKMLKLHETLKYDTERPFELEDEENLIRIFSSLNHRLAPFNITNLYGLMNDYGVHYERSPADVACAFDEDCCGNKNVDFVFCDTSTYKCASKLSEGALIRQHFPVRACYCPPHKTPSINSGRCSCK